MGGSLRKRGETGFDPKTLDYGASVGRPDHDAVSNPFSIDEMQLVAFNIYISAQDIIQSGV